MPLPLRPGPPAAPPVRPRRFGYRAAGTAALLQELGPRHGLRVHVLELVQSEAHTVSSSGVRNALGSGDMARVAALLDRPYCLELRVESAHQGGAAPGAPLRLALHGACANQPPGPGAYAVAAAAAGGEGGGGGGAPQEGRLLVEEGGHAAVLEGVRLAPGQQLLALSFL
eukprot:scaffold9.g3031.t1